MVDRFYLIDQRSQKNKNILGLKSVPLIFILTLIEFKIKYNYDKRILVTNANQSFRSIKTVNTIDKKMKQSVVRILE